jgi:hypothetical protein
MKNRLEELAETPPRAARSGFPVLNGAYLGQTPPGPEPEVFAPGVISTGLSELNSVFTADGKEFYYAVDTGLDWVIMMTAEEEGVWSEPEVVSFTRGHSGVDLCITRDGDRLFYCSNRSRTGGSELENNLDIWYVDRTPRLVGADQPRSSQHGQQRVLPQRDRRGHALLRVAPRRRCRRVRHLSIPSR